MTIFYHFYLLVQLFTLSVFLLFVAFALNSYSEKETKAANKALLCALTLPWLFAGTFFITPHYSIFSSILTSVTWLAIIAITIPIGRKSIYFPQSNALIDERDTMFSRKEISNNETLKKEYYKQNPQYNTIDEQWRQKPGLMTEKSSMYQPLAYAAADASFFVIGNLKPFVDGKPVEKQTNVSEEKSTEFIKQWAKKLGALNVGKCNTKPYHFYSHRGRGKVYGKPVDNEHSRAIAITVEMNKELLDSGPAAPTLMESAQQYLHSGVIALQLAQFIRNLGFEARAHIDGDYELICPLVARDAGLGEIGRMGLLMTPKLGPRVRIAVVTTNLPLTADKYIHDNSIQEFCKICKKCAEVCPSQGISKKDRTIINGNLRWQINQEKCFDYWCSTGTDCGRCMSTCPYSHPDNLFHNSIRLGIKVNPWFRHVALRMDDFFYGRKPKPSKTPDWINSFE